MGRTSAPVLEKLTYRRPIAQDAEFNYESKIFCAFAVVKSFLKNYTMNLCRLRCIGPFGLKWKKYVRGELRAYDKKWVLPLLSVKTNKLVAISRGEPLLVPCAAPQPAMPASPACLCPPCVAAPPDHPPACAVSLLGPQVRRGFGLGPSPSPFRHPPSPLPHASSQHDPPATRPRRSAPAPTGASQTAAAGGRHCWRRRHCIEGDWW